MIKKYLLQAWDYYRGVRFNNLLTPKYNHILLALYWPLFGLAFLFVERGLPAILDMTYHPVKIPLDDVIPFCEWFAIPYYYWFGFLIGFGVFWAIFEPRCFRDWMWAIILTYTTTIVIYLIYPTMQELRPLSIPRDNLLTRVVLSLYDFDTNTNVCPSIHVLGSLAVMFAGLHSKLLSGWGWKLFFILSALAISVSTVFMKQHSALDIFAAFLVGFICYAVQFWLYPVLEKKFYRPKA